MRMLDRFYSEIFDKAGFSLIGVDPSTVPDAAPVPVEISEAVRFFYEESPQEDWDFREDFHCSASPFEVAWYECAAPLWSNSDGRRAPGPGQITDRMGWSVFSHRVAPELGAKLPDENPLLTMIRGAASSAGKQIADIYTHGGRGLNGEIP